MHLNVKDLLYYCLNPTCTTHIPVISIFNFQYAHNILKSMDDIYKKRSCNSLEVLRNGVIQQDN